MECARCKVSSPLEEFFTQRKKKKNYCPNCNDDELRSSGIRTWLAILIGIPVCNIILNYNDDFDFLWIFLAMFWFSLLLYISIITHELGHFFAARALKGICPIVIFGEGPVVYSLKTSKTLWQFSLSPTLGLAYAVFSQEHNEKWRSIIMLSAGALANLLLGLVSLYLFLEGAALIGVEAGNYIWLICVITNTLLIVGSIFFSPSKGSLVSDGKAILTLLKGDKTSAKEHWTYEITIIHALILRNENRLLFEQIRASKDYKESAHHMSALSYAYALNYDHEKFLECSQFALSLFEENQEKSLITGTNKDYMKAILMNNLAYALYSSGSRDISKMLEL